MLSRVKPIVLVSSSNLLVAAVAAAHGTKAWIIFINF